MKPKNIVVTGGNSGIGYETVKALYEDGHNVIFGSRSQARNEEALKQITKSQGGSLIAFSLDLSKRKSIEQFVKNVQSKFGQIDILINNAGLMISGDKQTSELGFQMTLAINHFGPFYLTYLLWTSLVKSQEARIINVSSQIHYHAPQQYLTDLQCNNKSYSAISQYGISKLYNVLFTRGLNDLITKNKLTHVKTASLHPGAVETNFGNDNCIIRFFRCCCCCLVIDQERGARTSLFLSNSPFSEIRSGEYYDYDTNWKEMDRRGRSQTDVENLWLISQKAFGVQFR